MARVSEEIREVLAEEIQRLKDPRMGFVTVTGVKVTPDLRHARVFYTVYGDEKAHAGTRAALKHSLKYLRGVVGREVRLKFTPDLVFEEDPALTEGGRIEELLREVHRDE